MVNIKSLSNDAVPEIINTITLIESDKDFYAAYLSKELLLKDTGNDIRLDWLSIKFADLRAIDLIRENNNILARKREMIEPKDEQVIGY